VKAQWKIKLETGSKKKNPQRKKLKTISPHPASVNESGSQSISTDVCSCRNEGESHLGMGMSRDIFKMVLPPRNSVWNHP